MNKVITQAGKKTWSVPVLLLIAVLTACSSVDYTRDGAPASPQDVSHVKDAVPRVEPRSRYGNPDSYEVYGRRYRPLASSAGYREIGHASWYGTKFHGRRTSSGEPYDMYRMTAAHKTLPLPSYVEVTNLQNGRKVILRVNDRGPFHDGRIIDLSYAAARKLGMLDRGTTRVEVRAIDPRAPGPANAPPDAATAEAVFLQVGAFTDRGNAERLQRHIEGQNLGGVRIVEATTNNGVFYRVQVGPLADTGEADRVARELKPLGINERSYVR